MNIAASLEQLFTDWEIPIDCVKYIGTNSGRNIRASARRLPWLLRACFAHILHLGISNEMSCTPALNRLCKKAKAISVHYRHSHSAQKRLNDLQT